MGPVALAIYGILYVLLTNQMAAELEYLSSAQQPHGSDSLRFQFCDSCSSSRLVLNSAT